jgi:hypothetical protein
MKKSILLLLSLTLFSCASRKVDTKIDKRDSTSVSVSNEVEKTKTDTQTQTVVIDSTETEEIDIVPIDTTKPLIVNGKKFFNAKLRYKKQRNNIRTSQTEKVAEIKEKRTKKRTDTRVVTKQKEKTTEAVRFPWWLIVLGAVLVYLLLRRSKI